MGADGRGPEDVRRDIATEREALAGAVEDLKGSLDLRPKLPLLAGGAAAAGFVLGGGVGAVARLVFRRRREGKPTAKVGRYTLVEKR